MKLWQVDRKLVVPWSDDMDVGQISREWVKERRRLARKVRRKFKAALKARRGYV